MPMFAHQSCRSLRWMCVCRRLKACQSVLWVFLGGFIEYCCARLDVAVVIRFFMRLHACTLMRFARGQKPAPRDAIPLISR